MNFKTPTVKLLHATPLWIAEVAARTAYDSFSKSEHEMIQQYPEIGEVNSDIETSEILTSLSWVHHHHSVIEMVDIILDIKEISRGVLQELVRHRIASLTVRSTRYTMSDILNAYIEAHIAFNNRSKPTAHGMFDKRIRDLGVLVLKDKKIHELESKGMYDKLNLLVGNDYSRMLSKQGKHILEENRDSTEPLFEKLQKAKKKRNVGDEFKLIVTDNWSTNLLHKMNLRSLKNFLELRDSGAAYAPMQELAQEMKAVIPAKYLKLIVKEKNENIKRNI